MKNHFSRAKSRGINKILVVLLILIIVFASASVYFFLSAFRAQDNPHISTNSISTITSPFVTEYNVIDENSAPNGIAVDSSGNVWFVVQNGSSLGVRYSNSSIKTFPIPVPPERGIFLSYSVVIDNARNLVWFGQDSGASNGIWSFNEETLKFKLYNFSTAFPFQLAIDSSGNVWFTESGAGKIGEIMTDGAITQYQLPASILGNRAGPAGLTIDRKGNAWFTDPLANTVGSLMVSANSYAFHLYNLTGRANEPTAIAVDSTGNIWITEHGPSLIAEFDPATNFLRSISTHIPPILENSLPYFVYIDSQGNIWFNEHLGNAIAMFSPSNNSLVEYLIPTRNTVQGNISGALTMTLAPNGTPWFAEWFTGRIGTVNLQVSRDLSLSFQNSSQANSFLDLSQDRSLNLWLNISSNQSAVFAVYLSSSDYNRTLGFSYSFSPSSGNGQFSTNLSIMDQGMARGTYFLTVSAETNDLIVSRVIEVNAT